MQEKIPPQNIEVEKSLLGCMLMDKEAIITVSAWLLPDHFYENKHILIYSAILDLFNNGLPVDLITVVDKLKKKQKTQRSWRCNICCKSCYDNCNLCTCRRVRGDNQRKCNEKGTNWCCKRNNRNSF